MDLIFADVLDGELVDRGVLHNYEYDFSFGESENDFELKIPLSGTRLVEGQVVYLNDTEFGGIIDSIKVDTANEMLVYEGRTWHGVIENKVIYPRKGESYFTVEGEANAVLAELLERMNLIAGDLNSIPVAPQDVVIGVSEEDSGLYVSATVQSDEGNYSHGYKFIRDLLFPAGAKPQIVNGKLSAVPYIDYANDDDFLANTDQFTAKRIYNALNHVHCMGQGDWGDRYEIDIFTDKNGGVLPFCKFMNYYGLVGNDTPDSQLTDDNDYYTDISALADLPDSDPNKKNYDYIVEHMQTGVDEIAEIYDYPNASITYHYIPQTEKPEDWDTDLIPWAELNDKEYGFEKYYYLTAEGEDDTPEFKSISKPDLETEYKLQIYKPEDWESDFNSYYTSGVNGYEKVTSVNEYDVVSTMPADWYSGGYANYFHIGSGGNYTKVTLEDYYQQLTGKPTGWDEGENCKKYSYYDSTEGKYKTVQMVRPPKRYKKVGKTKPEKWAEVWKDYYFSDGVEYKRVQGQNVDEYKPQTVIPSDWRTNWKNYYQKSGKDYVKLSSKKAPAWKAKKYYTKETTEKPPKWDKKKTYYLQVQDPDHAPDFDTTGPYFTKAKRIPIWGSETFYKKRTYPNWTYNTYYTAYKYQPIPAWSANDFYTRYEDHYESLIKGALQKIEKENRANELNITLDEKRTYDINDRVGASDEVTGIWAVARIVQKTLKIRRGVPTFTYKTGQ